MDELCIRISEDVDYLDCPDLEQEETVEIDAVLKTEDMRENLIKTVERFEPYGEQCEPLLFLIEGARIESINAMQNAKDPAHAHLRVTVSYGNLQWPCVFWGAGQRVGADFGEGEIVDFVFKMGRNYYKNQELIQLTVVDMRRH